MCGIYCSTYTVTLPDGSTMAGLCRMYIDILLLQVVRYLGSRAYFYGV